MRDAQKRLPNTGPVHRVWEVRCTSQYRSRTERRTEEGVASASCLVHSLRQSAGCSRAETEIDRQWGEVCRAYSRGNSHSRGATSSPRSLGPPPPVAHANPWRPAHARSPYRLGWRPPNSQRPWGHLRQAQLRSLWHRQSPMALGLLAKRTPCRLALQRPLALLRSQQASADTIVEARRLAGARDQPDQRSFTLSSCRRIPPHRCAFTADRRCVHSSGLRGLGAAPCPPSAGGSTLKQLGTSRSPGQEQR